MEVLRGQADVFPDESLFDDDVQKTTQLCFLLAIFKRWVDQVIMGPHCSHWCSAGCSMEPPPPQWQLTLSWCSLRRGEQGNTGDQSGSRSNFLLFKCYVWIYRHRRRRVLQVLQGQMGTYWSPKELQWCLTTTRSKRHKTHSNM